jgi:hypothetical protein
MTLLGQCTNAWIPPVKCNLVTCHYLHEVDKYGLGSDPDWSQAQHSREWCDSLLNAFQRIAKPSVETAELFPRLSVNP